MANIERLKTLSCILKNHDKVFPEVGFNLTTWKTETAAGSEYLQDTRTGNICGTTACALGSAACYPPFMEQGLRLKYAYGSGQRKQFSVVYDGCDYEGDGFTAGQNFFEITSEESRYLFSPGRYEDALGVTSADVAMRVDELINKYSKQEDSKNG